MNTLFNTIINMSITGSIVIAAVIIIRFLLKKLPKKYSYLLWSVVAFRLCVPVSFESIISIFQFKPLQAHPKNAVSESGVMPYVPMPEPKAAPLPQMTAPPQGGSNIAEMAEVQQTVTITDVLPYVWLAGVVLFALWGIVSYIRFNGFLSSSVKYIDNIYQSDRIETPLIFGIIKPKIYIPFEMNTEYFSYVIAHERYHIKRCDYLVKLFAFFVLALHWFNPLCYLAFYLMSKDMEMSCDEKVLGSSENVKKNYSYALLSFATDKKFPAPTPICFGEGSVKSRIKNILKFKKPKLAVSVIAVLLCGLVLVSCAANPKSDNETEKAKMNFLIENDYKAYAIGDCIGMPSSFSSISDGSGYAYISKENIVIRRESPDEHFDYLYHSSWTMTADITKNYLKQEFEINDIVRVSDDNAPEIPDFKQGRIIMYYDAVYSSSPSYSVYVFDDVPYMIEQNQSYFLLTFDEEENEKLKDKDYLTSFATLSKNQSDYIDALFNSLENPDDALLKASSNPGDYIVHNKEAYNTLVDGGIYTMQYIVNEFSKGGQTGLKGHLMRSVMDEIIGGEALKLYAETGQEYFDAWAKHTNSIFSQSSAEDVEIMKQTCPYGYWYYTNYRTMTVADGFEPFSITNSELFKLSKYGDVLKFDAVTEFLCDDEIMCLRHGEYYDLYKSDSDMSLCAFIGDQLYFRNIENNILYRMPIKFYGFGIDVKCEEPVPVCDIGYTRICDAGDDVITICDGSDYYDIHTKNGAISKSDFNSIVSLEGTVSYAGISREEAIEKAKTMAVDINNYIYTESDFPDNPDPFTEVISCELISKPDMYGFVDADSDDYFTFPRPNYGWRVQLKNNSYYATVLIPLDEDIAGGCKLEKIK